MTKSWCAKKTRDSLKSWKKSTACVVDRPSSRCGPTFPHLRYSRPPSMAACQGQRARAAARHRLLSEVTTAVKRLLHGHVLFIFYTPQEFRCSKIQPRTYSSSKTKNHNFLSVGRDVSPDSGSQSWNNGWNGHSLSVRCQ